MNTAESNRFLPQLRALATVLLIATVTSACTSIGPDFLKPEAQVSGDWIEKDSPGISTREADNGAWWQGFEDPVLDTLIRKAYEQNLSLRIAGIRVLEARAQLGIAVGTSFPQLQVGAGAAIYNSASESVANTQGGDLSFTTFSAGFDAGWELDFWGKFQRGIESADANLLASVADYDNLLVSLTAEVANAYTVIRTFEERLKIARENVVIQQRSLKITDVRFTNGATTELDVQQARALLRNTEATIPILALGHRLASNALSILLGIPPGDLRAVLGDSGAIPRPPAEISAGVPAELLRRRPDVRQAELQAAAQSALIGVAEADLYPSFQLAGTIGVAASSGTSTTRSGSSGFGALFDIDSMFFSGGPGFRWNILNYGRIKNNVRVQDARLQQLLVNYQNTVLRAAQEAEDGMAGFLRTQEQVGYLGGSVKASLRSVELALIQYRDGAADYTRVLNTQEFLVQQQDALTAARGEVVRNLIAMYKALGGGWQLRKGKAFVPESTLEAMRRRTDWGKLLELGATDVPSGDQKRSPDW